jgi:hypothetical protein
MIVPAIPLLRLDAISTTLSNMFGCRHGQLVRAESTGSSSEMEIWSVRLEAKKLRITFDPYESASKTIAEAQAIR